MDTWIDLRALSEIIAYGLLCGAGLPAIFALGLRALSRPPAGLRAVGTAEDQTIRANPIGIGVAGLCFLVVLASICWGIYFIIDGS